MFVLVKAADRFWTWDYWAGETDARPLALFRIGFGLLILQDLARRLPVLEEFFTDAGTLPRGVPGDPWAHGLFDLVGSYSGVLALFALGTLATIAMTVGYRTRWSTFATWLFTLSIQNRNLPIVDGGDDLTRVLLFWSLFTNCGAIWSLDARRDGVQARVPALGLRMMCWQLAAVYVPATIGKLAGDAPWITGHGIYQTLQLSGFVRPPGTWALAYPTLCAALTWGTLVIEAALPLLILSPIAVGPSRLLAIALNAGLHFGILLMMRVGMFSGVMIWASVFLIRGEWLDRLMGPVKTALPSVAPTTISVGYRVLIGGLLVQMAFIWWIGVGRFVPGFVEHEIEWVQLRPTGNLFGNTILVHSWRTIGQLADGTTVDILPATIPALQPQPGYLFSRWTKYTFRPRLHFDALGVYLCKKYNAETRGPRLVSFVLVRDVHLPTRSDRPAGPTTTEELASIRCPE